LRTENLSSFLNLYSYIFKAKHFLIVLLLPSFLFASVKQEIINFYKSHYPTMEIEKIISNKPFPKHYKHISFKLANYKLPNITLKIDGKYYFVTIKAKIGVYVAKKVIKTNEEIVKNAEFKTVPFKVFYSPPLYKLNDNLIASKIISKNSVINLSNTKIKPAVLKGEKIPVIFTDKNIEIYSTATSLQDGEINQTIKVKINGKIYSGKINKNKTLIIK